MDELFSDQNSFKSNSFDFESFNENEVNYNKRNENKFKTTTIEKVISPIRKPVALDQHLNYGNIDRDFDHDLSFNKSKTTRKYPSLKKSMSLEFSPIMRSTPKPSKTRKSRKHLKRTSISLWDKAIDKNPELRQWIDSFNEDMKKIESSELSVSQSSISFTN